MGRSWAGVIAALLLSVPPLHVRVGDFALTGTARWVVLASRPDLNAPIGVARHHRWQFPGVRVVRAADGWSAVVAGPENAANPRALRQRLTRAGGLPGDFIYSRGDSYAFEDLDGDGTYELLSGDNSFLYAFDPYASANPPAQIHWLCAGRLEDVTRHVYFAGYQRQRLAGMKHAVSLDPERWHDNNFLGGWVAQSILVGSGEAPWVRMQQLYNRNAEWSFEECTVALPLGKCPDARRRKIDFPTARRRHLNEGGNPTPWLAPLAVAPLAVEVPPRPARYEVATAAFEALPVDERVRLQVVLTATGHQVAVPNVEFLKRLPERPQPSEWADFFLVDVDNPEAGVGKLIEIVTRRIPRAFGLDPVRDVQVLTPMQRGVLGSRNLNHELQRVLNPDPPQQVERFGWRFAPGDRVMDTQNDYDREVFNGDLGMVSRIDDEEEAVVVSFDGREVLYPFGELDTLVPAFATTIHKSQGSEYPAVVIPLVTAHFTMLARNLLYTAVTRGKRLVVLVGQRKAIGMAVRGGSRQRYTKLGEWMGATSTSARRTSA